MLAKVRVMNARERFLEVASFGNPDKVPLDIWDVRPATRIAWIRQGLPERQSVPEYLGLDMCALRSVSITSYPSEGFKWEPSSSAINIGPIPPFEYKIISEDERYRVWVDSLGVTQRGFQDDWRDGWSGFATRVFMKFPVKDMQDFVKIKKRYNAKDPKRYPRKWGKMAKAHRKRSYPLFANIRGPFWWTRDMLGLEKVAIGIHKEPEIIKEVMQFCAEFHIETLNRALDDLDVDYVIIHEDMGYKGGPMIGPEAVRRYMVPAYGQIVNFLRDHCVKLIGVDSDGNVEPLIPVWLETGISCLTPCEVAAGMDVVKLGEKYPKLVMMGGIDKRELAKAKKAIEKEVTYKVPHLVERRGYFPGVDHAVPPDISLENFRYFVSTLKKLCRWTG